MSFFRQIVRCADAGVRGAEDARSPRPCPEWQRDREPS